MVFPSQKYQMSLGNKALSFTRTPAIEVKVEKFWWLFLFCSKYLDCSIDAGRFFQDFLNQLMSNFYVLVILCSISRMQRLQNSDREILYPRTGILGRFVCMHASRSWCTCSSRLPTTWYSDWTLAGITCWTFGHKMLAASLFHRILKRRAAKPLRFHFTSHSASDMD